MSCLATSRSLNVARTAPSGVKTSRVVNRIVCKAYNQSSENVLHSARQAALIAGAALMTMVRLGVPITCRTWMQRDIERLLL